MHDHGTLLLAFVYTWVGSLVVISMPDAALAMGSSPKHQARRSASTTVQTRLRNDSENINHHQAVCVRYSESLRPRHQTGLPFHLNKLERKPTKRGSSTCPGRYDRQTSSCAMLSPSEAQAVALQRGSVAQEAPCPEKRLGPILHSASASNSTPSVWVGLSLPGAECFGAKDPRDPAERLWRHLWAQVWAHQQGH